MMRERYKIGNGLGKNEKCSIMPLEIVENKGRYNMGYKPTRVDRRIIIEEKIERSEAKMEGREPRLKESSLCSLVQSFYSAR